MWCRGRESNPHAAFATQDFKPSNQVSRSGRSDATWRFLACFQQSHFWRGHVKTRERRFIPASGLPVEDQHRSAPASGIIEHMKVWLDVPDALAEQLAGRSG